MRENRLLGCCYFVTLAFLLAAFPLSSVMALDEMIPIDLQALGAAGDGESNDTPFFLEALNTIGDSTAVLDIVRGIYVVESLVFPENVTLRFRDGGQLAVAAEHTIEINGNIDAGIHRIFSGDGSVGGKVVNLYIYPQWFGAAGDGVRDDARALQQSADLAAGAMGRTLFIPEGNYLFTEDVLLRCNVENRGLFIIELEIDEDRTEFSNDLFLPSHYPKKSPRIRFINDYPEQMLAPESFYGIAEGDLTLPNYRDLPLADGSGAIDLEEGGTLCFYSTDFFSSRNVRKGAHFYDRNDICQIVSGRGAVFPEFAFDYSAPPDAPPWDENTVYSKGDYCTFEGEVFKSTYSSGSGTSFRHRHFGEIQIGPVPPIKGFDSVNYNFTYEDGTPDNILIWRRIGIQVWYRQKDTPLTVNGFRMEVRLLNHGGETKRIMAGSLRNTRSNMTFNNLEITVRDREATISQLLQSEACVNVEFNNGYFSGATCAHLGYNILNSNVGNFRYNHCISTNSRKGMDGRHGKNIYVTGGFYNVIDDHYGRNYVIRDITMSGLSVSVPFDSTPRADLQAWEFRARGAMSFNGANFSIQNVTVNQGVGGVMGARTDIGDLYGNIVLRDINIRNNRGNVLLFYHHIDPNFDYGHDVKVPDKLTIENINLENPAQVQLMLGNGFGNRPYGPVYVWNTNVGNVFSASPETHFHGCRFNNSGFNVTEAARIHFWNCIFSGECAGLKEKNIGIATGNLARQDAKCSFPIEYRNENVLSWP